MLQVGHRRRQAAVVGQGVGQGQAAQARGGCQAGYVGAQRQRVATQVELLRFGQMHKADSSWDQEGREQVAPRLGVEGGEQVAARLGVEGGRQVGPG